MIYLDNAATTLKKPEQMLEAMVRHMERGGNAGRGGSEAALFAGRTIYETRRLLAELFGAEDPSRIAFTANSTESLNMAIRGCLEEGDHVITTELEHNSVLRPLYEREQAGVSLSIIEADEKGRIDYQDIEKAIRPETKAIVCTHGSNVTGNILDIEWIGACAKRHNLLFIVDASQTAGVIPIDVQKMKIDILCFTGHKSLMGPQGTGGIYVKRGVSVKPLVSGGTGIKSFLKTQPEEMPEHLEAGTLNGPGIAGLGASAGYLMETGIQTIYEKEHQLMKLFYESVKEIPEITIYGDFEETKARCPVVSINIGEMDSSEVSDWLMEDYGIATRPGAHCAPLMHGRFGTRKQGIVRFSFSWYNTEEEVEKAAEAVREIALAYREDKENV